MASGEWALAEQQFRQALKLKSEFSEAWTNLGYVRCKVGDANEAEQCYRKAMTLSAHLEEPHLLLGVLLMNLRRFTESEQSYRDYLKQHPESAAAWSNLGVLLACLKREPEAEQCYRTALAHDPSFKKASFSLSYILLRQERFEEAWRCLEDRWLYPVFEQHFRFGRWGGEPLDGKSVIIGFEAGHGDMIFYGRYVAALKAQGVRNLALICHPGLKRLFETLDGVDTLYSYTESVPVSGWDYWTPPMSLPYYFQTRPDTIPATVPYLHAEPGLVEKWKAELPRAALRVGLVWKGSASFENDDQRSLSSLNDLAPLGAVQGVHFVSLQKGQGEADALQPPAGLILQDLGSRVTDFADTAAIIQQLDLVITVDTAVAHLAGAMGIPCWVLLPDFKTDWRWAKERSDSLWYPKHMRLFRQPPGGGWSPVVSSVLDALSALKSGRNSLTD